MSTPAQPIYLDEQGNPKQSGPQLVQSAPAPAPPSGGAVYLDDQGNVKGPANVSSSATMGPQPKAADVGTGGALGEVASAVSPIGQLTMPLVKGLIAAHDKLREVENLTQEGQAAHPIQAHIGDLANRIEGLLTGNPQHPEAGIGTGEAGLLTNPVTASLVPGAGGTPALAEGIEGAANLAKGGYQAAKEAMTGGEGPNIVKQVFKGKGVAQEPAKAAIRSMAGADEDTALLEGNKTVLDSHLNDIAQKEKAAYKVIDDKAGFDVKEAKIRLKNDQYKVKQLGNTEADQNAREKLDAAIKDMTDRIAKANVDTSEADTLHKSRMAGQEFKKALIKNTSADGQSVNVDGLLTASKNLRAMSKYGDRLEQFMGKEGADKFMEELQAAQKMGAHALKVQRIAKVIGGSLASGAVGGEIVRHALP